MATVDSRTFLGYEAGFLTRAARALLEGGRESLRKSVIVVPGRRAGRKLLEALVREAGGALEPPRIVTETGLAEALSRRPLAFASQPLLECAWFEALGGAAESELAPLARFPRTWAERWSLARSLSALDRDQAAEVVESRPDGRPLPAPAAVLARFSARVGAALERTGRVDPARSLASVAAPSARREGLQVVLVGMVELSPALARLLASLDPPPLALIQAPAAEAQHFDGFGALVVESWESRAIPLRDEDWCAVEDPAAAAAASLDWLARLPRGTASDQVVLGVLGDSLLPGLRQAFAGEGLELHSGAGEPLRSSSPWLALDALRAWTARSDFAALAALVRHPAIAACLRGAADAAPADLDLWHADHLPDGVGGALAGGDKSGALKLRDGVAELCAELAGREPRPLSSWSAALGALLARLYPELPADEGPDADRTRQALQWYAGLSAELAGADLPVTGVQALALWLDWAAEERLRTAQRPGAIEALGWLELALEDAPQLLLCGLNDGWVPRGERARSLGDAAAPERRARARLARDVHCLTAIAARRLPGAAGAGLFAITLRKGDGDEPLRPSRLLFHAADTTALARARRVILRTDAQGNPRRAEDAGAAQGPEVMPLLPARELESVSISGLAAFVSSPYFFYLEHVMKLRRVRDDAWELDPRGFGSLAHDVLERFGSEGPKHSEDPEQIRNFVRGELRALAQARFGHSALPAVRLQLQQLERRLSVFADHQAALARDGWRIHAVEHTLRNAALEVGGTRVAISGRIDRIDRNERSGAWRVLDYKTGDSGVDPLGAHLRDEEWLDFQLPLYRHFLRGELEGEIEVGYFALPRQLDDCGVHLAAFAPGADEAAVEAARRVVAEIRKADFRHLGRARPLDRVQRALCGSSLLELDDSGEDQDPSDSEEAP